MPRAHQCRHRPSTRQDHRSHTLSESPSDLFVCLVGCAAIGRHRVYKGSSTDIYPSPSQACKQGSVAALRKHHWRLRIGQYKPPVLAALAGKECRTKKNTVAPPPERIPDLYHKFAPVLHRIHSFTSLACLCPLAPQSTAHSKETKDVPTDYSSLSLSAAANRRDFRGPPTLAAELLALRSASSLSTAPLALSYVPKTVAATAASALVVSRSM